MVSPQLFCQLQSTCHSGLSAALIGCSDKTPCPLFLCSQLASEGFVLCRSHLAFPLLGTISQSLRACLLVLVNVNEVDSSL